MDMTQHDVEKVSVIHDTVQPEGQKTSYTLDIVIKTTDGVYQRIILFSKNPVNIEEV